MATTPLYDPDEKQTLIRQLGRALLSILVAMAILWALASSFSFIKDKNAPEQLLLWFFDTLGMDASATALRDTGLDPLMAKLILAIIALAVGVAGIWLLYWVANDLIDRLPSFNLRERLRPIIFVGPAVILLGVYLIYPAFNTAYLSLTEDIINLPEEIPEEFRGQENIAQLLAEGARNVEFDGYWLNSSFIEIVKVSLESGSAWIVVRGDNITTFGLQNYKFAFTDPDMHIAFRNNILWLVFGTSFSVGLGLLIATLVDRIRQESLAKSFIFLPLAISFVGASVIWKFVYAWQPAGRPQIGILNAFVTALGFDPIPWLINPPLNTFALIYIMIWLQTGFAMVILSAALKGVPTELIEAARIDGASEIQTFFRIIIPYIRGAIITVATTIFIAILKVFDIVFVMTSGKFETEVIANRMFVEMFNFRNFGRASALAVILLIVVTPIMVVNIRNLRKQGVNQ
jgi:alpha-glucoside transport system permease protein